MTIDEFVKYAHDHNYVIKTQESENQALCIMNAYEKIRNDYDTRLKADLVAMLEVIKLRIDDLPEPLNRDRVNYCIQEKINALKAEIEPQEKDK